MMNVAANAATNVAIMAAVMRKRMIQHFEKAGAFSAETAIPLPPKHPRSTVNALIKHKVIVPAGEGLFYLDREADARSLREQGKAAMAVLGMLVLIGLIVLGMVLVGRG
ncbi:hypothetical protein [Brevundimonas sp. CEF1]|uniref:hypothetical protein n=1 Tax=Brevundimonas sp. CEF1 TaxID=3442642 RepID=UPI003F518BC0